MAKTRCTGRYQTGIHIRAFLTDELSRTLPDSDASGGGTRFFESHAVHEDPVSGWEAG